MLDLKDLEAFVRVVQAGGFTAVAVDSDVAKSSVSKAVTRLEHHLKVQLLNRNTRSVSPTEMGARLYAQAQQLLAQTAQLEESTMRGSRSNSGLLRINLPTVFGRRVVIPALTSLFEKWPELRLDIKLTDQPEDLIEARRDVAVWIGKLPNRRLKYRTLARTTRVTCATKAYLDAHGTPDSVEALSAHRCLATSGWAQRLHWHFKSQSKFDALHLSPFLQVNTAEALREATLSGLGIAQASSFLFNKDLLAKKRLIELLPQESMTGDPISVVFPLGTYQSPLTRIFLDFLVEVTKEREDRLQL